MSGVSEEEEEEIIDEQASSISKKKAYTTQSRISKKPRTEQDEVSSSGSDDDDDNEDDDEEYSAKLKLKPAKKEDEEDDFQRQLRLEREEAEQKLKEKKTRKDDDGTEYEWDETVKGWFPKIPDQASIQYQQTYKEMAAAETTKQQDISQYAKPLPDTFYLCNGAFYKWNFQENKWNPADVHVYSYIDYMTGLKYDWDQESNEWKQSDDQPNKQQLAAAANEAALAAKKDASGVAKKAGWFEMDDDKNTNVYVSGLPLDITDEEFEEMMSKYGIIMKDPLTHKLKLKLYRDDETNEVKGDGRCCYLMPESVKLCMQLLDGSEYKNHTIKVEKAKFQMKGGSFDPKKAAESAAVKKKLSKVKEKKLVEKQRQRLLGWEERPEIVRQKHEKVVVIKNLFTPIDFHGNLSLLSKLKDDLKSELETHGVIRKIMIHDNHPEGVATVSFKEVEMADECCEYLNNRIWKNGQKITCEIWDGRTRYDMDEDEELRQRRIDEWHKFLESDD